MTNFSPRITGLDLVYRALRSLSNKMTYGNYFARRDLLQFTQDTFGVPSNLIEGVSRDRNSEIEGISIRLLDGRHVIVLDKNEMECVCEALAPCSVTFEGVQYVGFIDIPERRGQSIFWGDSPNIVEGSLVTGDLPEVLLHIRKLFDVQSIAI